MSTRDSKLLWWLLGTLVPIILGAAGVWKQGVDAKLDQHSTAIARGDAQQIDVQRRLQRIEDKVDVLLVKGK